MRIGDLRCWETLTVVPAENKANHFLPVNHSVTTIHHHHNWKYEVIIPDRNFQINVWMFREKKRSSLLLPCVLVVSVRKRKPWLKKNANLNFVEDCTRESTEAVLGECSALTSKENTVIDSYFITAAGFIYLFTRYFKLTYIQYNTLFKVKI